MSVEVVFPEEVLVALREPPEEFRRRVLIYTLGKLYDAGRISGGLAPRSSAAIAGSSTACSRSTVLPSSTTRTKNWTTRPNR